MNEAKPTQQEDAIDVRQLARAIRFALVGIVLGLSYIGLRGSLAIEGFGKIFEDMLGKDERLPLLTAFILSTRLSFILVSVLVPILAVASLFFRSLVRSFYFIGVLGFITVTQITMLHHGLSAPLMLIIEKMNR